MASYDLSFIGRRIYQDSDISIFFAELIRLNEKKAIQIKTQNGIQISINNEFSGNLSKYQKIVMDNLNKGIMNSFSAWKKELDSDKQALKPLNISVDTDKALKKSSITFIAN
ncbi:hypothetical protein KJ780_00330, partial [Candidatus Micrarchaeota archaeon]|nr:hypothetical protein [Candidatus Micrarchaeota archaeon]